VEKLLMARFDVYPNPGQHAKTTPYLLDVQSDLLEGLDSCMVIPLRTLASFPKVNLPRRLTPVLAMDGAEFLLETPKMGAVPRALLKYPVVSLVDKQSQITAALNFLCQGF
jgi:toxin CcdB